jgi:putative radical SAM enzyme (TIGR03279 family)
LIVTNPENRRSVNGIKIRSLSRTSLFFRAGLRRGDIVVSVNNEKIGDELDFRFHTAAQFLQIEIVRKGIGRVVDAERTPGSFPEIEFYQKVIRRCANRCIFCFIDQMPTGLRRRLYIKDEDLTHSFLNGNYVTLTNARAADLDKIVSLGLSPLFVSVHATDHAVRSQLLGRSNIPPIMEQLRFLKKQGIAFNTQIVVCPGFNDGAVLVRTIRDLVSLGDNLLSIAVVPVGLTKHRKIPLAPVDHKGAVEICEIVGALSDNDAEKNGTRRLFLADEFFLKAGLPIPPRNYYEEYPQIENGVGLIRQLLEAWRVAKREFGRNRKKRKTARPQKLLFMTGVSAFPFVEKIGNDLERIMPGSEVRTIPVVNEFFGSTVTVAGLLSARDVISAARKAVSGKGFDRVLLPGAMFNYAGFTLDGYGPERMAKEIGVPVQVVQSVEELLEEKENSRKERKERKENKK